MKKITLEKCPCNHPACDAYFVRGLDFGDRGLLPKEQAEFVRDAVNERIEKMERPIVEEQPFASHRENELAVKAAMSQRRK